METAKGKDENISNQGNIIVDYHDYKDKQQNGQR